MSQRPHVVRNRFGLSSTLRYAAIERARLTDRPYGPRDGHLITYVYNFLGLREAAELGRRARVAVRGEVLAIGPPHYNSDDGGFWDPALHDEPGITDVSNDLYRDVLFRVDEVWGTTDPEIKPGSIITFLSLGGQVKVTLSHAVAARLELPYGGGTYVFSTEAPVELEVGEKALVFLDFEAVDGLYGGRYGERRYLVPAHPRYFKYTVEGGLAENAATGALSMPVVSLRALVASDLGRDAGPLPLEGTVLKSPHLPVTEGGGPQETAEPPHSHGEG